MGYDLSEGCLNPAIGLGLQLFKSFQINDTEALTNFWVFFLAPPLGGYLA